MGNKDGHCYMWPQTIGKRGALEISSMVYDFFKHKTENGAMDVVLYSDKYGGQNRNHYIGTMYTYAIQHLPLNSTTHGYLESGDSQNENDSIHAVIQRSKKGMTVSVSEQYYTLVATARGKPNKQYKVNEVMS